jgi:hypothetical protein
LWPPGNSLFLGIPLWKTDIIIFTEILAGIRETTRNKGLVQLLAGPVNGTCNPSTQNAEAGGLPVPAQPGLHTETLSQETKNKCTNTKPYKVSQSNNYLMTFDPVLELPCGHSSARSSLELGSEWSRLSWCCRELALHCRSRQEHGCVQVTEHSEGK